jgi:phage/conjugal plasmid C-4 type zinc finger TraR family protein
MDIIDQATDRISEIIEDRIGNIRAEINRPGVIDSFCDDCECLIPAKRMQAAPWATRCVTCQEEHEPGNKDR